jgi:uncharacterized protein YkwD
MGGISPWIHAGFSAGGDTDPVKRRFFGLFGLWVLTGGIAPAGTLLAAVPATGRPATIEQRILELMNRARSADRLCGREHFVATGPLAFSRDLRRAATAHALDMARRSYFEHRSPEGVLPKARVQRTGYRPALTGENIAFGPDSAEEVVAGWLSSPGHCANIMDPRFSETGVAVAQGRKRGHFYWVQVLARPIR